MLPIFCCRGKLWCIVETQDNFSAMSSLSFFHGSTQTKLDEKNRFVLPQHLRYGLIEGGELAFTMGIGPNGSLLIYRHSEIQSLIRQLKDKQYSRQHQNAFTLFFSTLHPLTCDKLGRVVMPAILKTHAKISQEIVICGVLDKIEIWSADRYAEQILGEGGQEQAQVTSLFSLLNQEEEEKIE
ncbi:MAG: hypothetical protein VXZ72_03610 [Chlamydiota bacterium]|nr:hypothetical protein [Chlamydiota bacterium]